MFDDKHNFPEAAARPDNAIYLASMCFLHQVHIASGAALVPAMPLVAQLYSTSALLRIPGYFTRVLRSCQHFVQESLVFNIEKNATLRDVHRAGNCRTLSICGFDSQDPAAAELLHHLNGDWQSPHIQHLCAGPQCCANRAECVKKASSILLRTVVLA